MTPLPLRTLGRTGFRVTALGLGAGSIGEPVGELDDPERDGIAVAAVRRGIELGINYLDTSPSYRNGKSERRVGLALRDGWRSRVLLATKAGTHPERPGDYSADAIAWSVERSLRVLGTGVVDVLLVHDPDDMAPVLAPGGALDALERLKAAGTIRAIGIGVQNHGHLRKAIETGRFDVIQTPYDYNLVRTTADPLLALAAGRNVGCINASPFQQGLLAGVDPAEANRTRVASQQSAVRVGDLERAHHLWRWAQERRVNLRALAVQFCLREPRLATTLIGPRTTSELEDDVEAATASLPDWVWPALGDLLPELPSPSPGGEAAVGAFPPLA